VFIYQCVGLLATLDKKLWGTWLNFQGRLLDLIHRKGRIQFW